jgi:hypothetical protein
MISYFSEILEAFWNRTVGLVAAILMHTPRGDITSIRSRPSICR